MPGERIGIRTRPPVGRRRRECWLHWQAFGRRSSAARRVPGAAEIRNRSSEMAHPRPPLPPGPWLVVGLARSGIAAGRALAARGEEVVGVDSGRPEVEAG